MLTVACAALAVVVPGANAGSNHHDARAKKLHAAEKLWGKAGLNDYSYRVRRSCFCPRDYTKAAIIAVENGESINPPREYKNVATVEKLFRVVKRNLDADRLHVTYSKKRGYPKLIAVDPSTNAADEEVSYEVDRFRKRTIS